MMKCVHDQVLIGYELIVLCVDSMTRKWVAEPGYILIYLIYDDPNVQLVGPILNKYTVMSCTNKICSHNS